MYMEKFFKTYLQAIHKYYSSYISETICKFFVQSDLYFRNSIFIHIQILVPQEERSVFLG